MVERKASLGTSFNAAREVIRFALEREEKRRYFNDYWPMFIWEKLAFIASKLRPQELKKLVRILSSVNHGGYILDSVFPRYKNPEDYNSRGDCICLSDKPVQVLGWKEMEELVQQGVEEGLLKDWVDVGFCERAEERGINLEWHFSEHPPRIEAKPGSPAQKFLSP